jgi:hypothetical protein
VDIESIKQLLLTALGRETGRPAPQPSQIIWQA